jgi:ABC-type Fe3+ transport system substrate-binding protein
MKPVFSFLARPHSPALRTSLTRRALLGTGASALALFAASGCNSGSTSTGRQGGGPGASDAKLLTIISPHGLEVQNEFTSAFEKQNPGVKLKWIDKGGTSDDLRFVQAQFKGKPENEGIGIDCFFGGGGETFLEMESGGMLQPLPDTYGVPAELNGVPLAGQNKTWVAAALSGFGILYNKSLAQRDNLPVPRTWADLGDPRLKGRIALADPRHSGSAHAAYEIILQTNGWDEGWKILTRAAANARGFSRSASDLPQDVARGEAVMAPCIDFYARAAIDRAGEAKLGYVAPQKQSVVTPDPIGILRGAPNIELARKWVAFVMSPEGQKLWMLEKGSQGGPKSNSLFRQAALPALYEKLPQSSLVKSSPYSVKNERAYDAGKAAKRRRALDELLGAVLIDNHKLIVAASGDEAKLSKAPITEEAMDQAAEQWDKAAFRTRTTSQWRQESATRFGG